MNNILNLFVCRSVSTKPTVTVTVTNVDKPKYLGILDELTRNCIQECWIRILGVIADEIMW